MSAITIQILNNLALKKKQKTKKTNKKRFVKFNSTATFAFESIAKRYGKLSASLIEILRAHQVSIK